MAATYRAFRNRRSLLLLHLEQQVRFEELPWVQAVARHRRETGRARQDARAALAGLGELALQGFPATPLPNPLVRELGTIARTAGVRVPWVEDLAADIFVGTFTGKFLAAARLAGGLLGGTLYERYYGIDYAAVAALEAGESGGGRDCPAFRELCHARAGVTGAPPSMAAKGMVIEQAQILTTHNLAALVHPIGVSPAPGWDDLARRSFTAVCRLTARVHHNPRPLATVKNAASAWRNMLFHLSLCSPEQQAAVVPWLDAEASRHPDHVAARLAPVLSGLRVVRAGGAFAADGTADTGRARRFLGWRTAVTGCRPPSCPAGRRCTEAFSRAKHRPLREPRASYVRHRQALRQTLVTPVDAPTAGHVVAASGTGTV